MPHRDRRQSPARPLPKDSIEQRAAEDVDRLKKLLQRTKAEITRSRTLAERLERRTKRKPESEEP